MNYRTHNERHIDINGTHLQGYVTASYEVLCDIFGEPTDGDAFKIDAQWIVLFSNGVIATIYNYKNGHNYCGAAGIPVQQIKEWHVGGASKEAPKLVEQLVRSAGQSKRVKSPAGWSMVEGGAA